MKQFLAACAAATLMSFAACTEPTAPDPTPTTPILTTVTVALASPVLTVGQTTQATASGVDQDGAPIATGPVTWASTANASVSANGVVTAIASGAATIVASAGGKSGQATLTIAPLPAAALQISTAPNNTLANRAVFASQPVIRLVNSANGFAAQAGVVVTASVSTGTMIGATTATTDASGIATFTGLGLAGTAGPRVITFSAPGLTSVTTSVALTYGAAVNIAINGGNQQTVASGAAVPILPSVIVTDADGNAVNNAQVEFSVTAGGGTVTSAQPSTQVNGIASVGSWTLGAPGLNTLQAKIAGPNGVAVTFSAMATQAPALATINVSITSSTIQAGQSTQASASGIDQYGASIATGALTWTSNSPNATVTATGLVTGVSAGQATITASASGKSGQVTVTVIVVPVLTTLTATVTPSAIQVGQTAQATATAVDQFGANIATGPVTWTATGPATITTTGLITGVSAGTAQIVATAGGKTAVASINITSVPVPPVLTSLVLSINPASIQVGANAQATVSGRDQFGAAIATGNIAWSSTNAVTVSATGFITGVSAGTATVTATAGSVSVQGTITITSAPSVPVLTSMSISVNPSTIVVGQNSQVSVLNGRDQFGMPIAIGTVAWSVTGPATVSQSGLVTGTNAGTARVTATAGAASAFVDIAITGAPPPPGYAGATVTFPATVALGQTYHIDVQGHDQYGAPFPIGQTVAYFADPPTVVTITQFGDFTVDHPGHVTISVAIGGLPVAQKIYDIPGTPITKLVIAPGPIPVVANGDFINRGLHVELRNETNNQFVPQQGVPVTATLTSGTGMLVGNTVEPLSNVDAHFDHTQFRGPVGVKVITFTAVGHQSTTYQFTVVAGPPTSAVLNAGDNQTAPAGTVVPIDPSVKVTDIDGNVAAGVAVQFTVTGGGGTLPNGAVATTDANGIARISWKLGGAGANTLRAIAAGVGTPVNFTATAN